MHKLRLILLASSLIVGSLLLLANPVFASQTNPQAPEPVKYIPAKPLYEVVFEQPNSDPMLEFTDEEANNAIQRFGCDCSGCLNAVRTLQGRLPLQ